MFDKFVRNDKAEGRKKLQCNECKRATIHTLEAECYGSSEWDVGHGNSLGGGTTYSLFRCGACDEVCFEKSSWFSEDFDYDDEGHPTYNRREEQYPPPSSADFAFNVEYTPPDLNELIDEMIYALSGSKMRLATVALRMVVEFIAVDKKCDGNNLFERIEDLRAKDLVDDTQKELLHTIRKKGNVGAHERIAMTLIEMVAGIAVIDLLLEKLYNAPARQEDVMKKAAKAFATDKSKGQG